MRNWTPHLTTRLTGLRLAPAREAEIIEELSQHLDDRYEELLREGASKADAERLALDEIDDHELLRRELRPLRQASLSPPIVPGATRGRLWADLWQDVRYATRMLGKQKAFTAAAVLTLALGIGANTAIFSLVNATLLQRLPARDSQNLVAIYNGTPNNVVSYPAYVALRDGGRTLEGYAAFGGLTASLNADGETDLVAGSIVTGNYFEQLGVTAAQGRLLSPADDVTVGGHPVAVISHRLWQRRFGGRADIVNHEILLNGHVFTIVGVTRPGFIGAQLGTMRDLYVPMMMQAVMRPPRAGYSGDMNPDLLKNAGNSWLFVFGRLKPGLTVDQTVADLSTVLTNYFNTLNPTGDPRKAFVVPIDEDNAPQRQQLRSVAWLLGAIVATVLLIACANVANLLLSRAASRRRELALRLAIGANRWRLVRQLLTESVLLATVGGLVGVGLAWLVARAFQAAPPPAGALPIAVAFTMDLRVLGFSFGLSLFTGIVFGLAPAFNASRPGLLPALKDESFVPDGVSRRFNLKTLLVVSEVALSLMLLVAAGLFVRSLQAAYTIDPGFDAPKLVSAPLNVNLLRYTRAQGREFYQRIVETVDAIPGVESATVARMGVISGAPRTLSFLVEGRTGPDGRIVSENSSGATTRNSVRANVVGPAYFQTLGIRRVGGRDFSSADVDTATPVTIVNEATVRKHFPGVDPIGKRVSFSGLQGPWVEIVGVVKDSTDLALGAAPAPLVYVPLSQNHETGVTLHVRSAVPPETLIPAVRRAIQAIEPNLPVPNIQTMAATIDTSLYAPRMGATLLSVFGGLALLLAMVGVYGVLAFSIARRTREMGIRVALGATARDVFTLVIGEGMTLVALGVVVGLGAAFFVMRWLSTFLYGISPRDGATFAIVTVVLLAVALLACVIPARRAVRVNPLTALRAD